MARAPCLRPGMPFRLLVGRQPCTPLKQQASSMRAGYTRLLLPLLALLYCDCGGSSQRQLLAVPHKVLERHAALLCCLLGIKQEKTCRGGRQRQVAGGTVAAGGGRRQAAVGNLGRLSSSQADPLLSTVAQGVPEGA